MTNLETDIFNYKTPEFYINMKNIPDKTSQERKSFVLEEKRKCREGININGIRIPGGLYFHLNYYHLQRDATDKELLSGSDKKIISLPNLRDNEWIAFNDYDQVEKDPKIYTLFGARQILKSELECSLTLRELSIFKNTEALALFQAGEDKDTFVKKIRIAIDHGEKFIIVPNIDKDWSKTEIRFGFTKQDNSVELRGTLYIYNTQEGKKIQVGSGKTVSFLFFDECAKSNFRAVYDTVEPALLTDSGKLRCAPIFTFTGGEVEKARDAENLVRYPNSKQFTSIIDNGQQIGGRFLNAVYRKDFKYPTTISEYIGIKTKTWLDDYPIMISNKELAIKTIEAEIIEAKKSPDQKTVVLKKIFSPLTIDDVFLTDSVNNFPVAACQAQQIWIKDSYEPVYIDLFRKPDNSVEWKESSKLPIDIYPVKSSDYKIAPIQMFEPPQSDAPHGTYCIGVDAYNSNESIDKVNSLGAIYVYKRMYNPLGEFQNQFVASYAGRPTHLSEFYQIALDTAEFYNGYVLPELNQSFIDFFIHKRKGYLLWDTINLARDILPTSRASNTKGLTPSLSNIKAGMNNLVEYANEDLFCGEGENTTQLLGVTRIKDLMLLEEMIAYKASKTGGHEINCDRIVAAYHALLLARHLDKVMPLTNWIPNSNVKEENIKKHINVRAFGNSFTNTSKTPFKPFGDSAPIKKPRLFGF